MSDFVRDIKDARRAGRLPVSFKPVDVKRACPGWAERTYTNFLPKHREGNPLGYTPYFRQNDDGTYSLREEPAGTPLSAPRWP